MPLFGRVYDVTGGYTGALAVAATVLLLCAVALLALGRYPTAARRES